jgi:hypothetical protein
MFLKAHERFKDGNLTGDIEIMHAGFQTSLHHRLGRAMKRAGTIQHRAHPRELLGRRGRIAQIECAILQFMRTRLLGERVSVAPAKHGLDAWLSASSRISPPV